MPELPEVETVRCQLASSLSGQTIRSVEIFRSGREEPKGQAFVDALQGRRIVDIDRRAKLIIWRFDNDSSLLAHLKMTGRFVFVQDGYTAGKHDRMLFRFDRLATPLVWSDIRQFGFVRIVAKKEELNRILDSYGPEPLETMAEELADRLKHPSTRRLKAALLNQEVIAGIGNIYADEVCHRAGLRPARRLGSLTHKDRMKLTKAIQSVLREAIAQRGTSANDYVDTRGERGGFLDLLRVYGREDEPCRTCGRPIKKIVLAQRGTHYCSHCQR